VFCKKQPPDVLITKEHLFADWLRELFPRSPDTTHTLGIKEWATTHDVKELHQNAQGHSGTKKIRHVCKTCNGTWMSNRVEESTMAILTDLINGNKTDVNHEMMALLATWSTKTVMTAEWVHPTRSVIHQSERTWLKEKLSPPEGWCVWIGTLHGHLWGELTIQQHLAKLRFPTVDDGNTVEHNVAFTAIGMRRLMIVVASSTWPRGREIIRELGSPHPSLFQIWPIVHGVISWPQTWGLGDRDAAVIASYYLGKFRGSAA